MTGCTWPRPWEYDEIIDVLARVVKFGINPSLEPIAALCEALGRPQDGFSAVQVAGTNGKTSVARLTAALLRAQGVKVGLYTSPELERYPERLEVDGRVSTDAQFARAVGVALDTARAIWGEREPGVPAGVTEFELLTAAALWHFRECGIEIAVLEVGMGGRWDATSVVIPSVAVITGVGLDHTHILGDTVEAIAAEKAAIIRPGSVPVLGPGTAGLEDVFLDACAGAGVQPRYVCAAAEASSADAGPTVRFSVRERPSGPAGTTVVDVEGLTGSYAGLALAAPAYQGANIAMAVAAAEAAIGRQLDAGRLRAALQEVALPGRFELVRRQPPIVVDGSHNPQAAAVLAETIAQAWPDPALRPLLLLGVLADKDAAGIVSALAPVAGAFAVAPPDSPRALSARDLAAVVCAQTGAQPLAFESVGAAAVELAAAKVAGVGLVVTGSLVAAGQARRALRDASVTGESPRWD